MVCESTQWFIANHLIHDFFAVKVVSGEKHDIDLIVEGPTTHIIYQEHRKEYDSVEFNATVSKMEKKK